MHGHALLAILAGDVFIRRNFVASGGHVVPWFCHHQTLSVFYDFSNNVLGFTKGRYFGPGQILLNELITQSTPEHCLCRTPRERSIVPQPLADQSASNSIFGEKRLTPGTQVKVHENRHPERREWPASSAKTVCACCYTFQAGAASSAHTAAQHQHVTATSKRTLIFQRAIADLDTIWAL